MSGPYHESHLCPKSTTLEQWTNVRGINETEENYVCKCGLDELQARCTRVEAENARLLRALEMAVGCSKWQCDDCYEDVRAALATDGKAP